jgi:hypothetical protein
LSAGVKIMLISMLKKIEPIHCFFPIAKRAFIYWEK